MEFITDFTLIHFRLNLKTVTDTFKALKRILGKRRGRKREKAEWVSSFFDQQSKRPSTEFKVTDDLNRSELQRHDAFGSCCCFNVSFFPTRFAFVLQLVLYFRMQQSLPSAKLASELLWPSHSKKDACDVSELHLLNLNEGFTLEHILPQLVTWMLQNSKSL